MVDLELECRLVMQRMADRRRSADRRRLLLAARTARVERPIAEIVQIPRPTHVERERGA